MGRKSRRKWARRRQRLRNMFFLARGPKIDQQVKLGHPRWATLLGERGK